MGDSVECAAVRRAQYEGHSTKGTVRSAQGAVKICRYAGSDSRMKGVPAEPC
jgi:hypothetical protein